MIKITKSRLEQQMAALINLERKKHGLRQVSFCNDLCLVGRKHSLEQLRANTIYHDSPITGSVADRLVRDNVGFISCGENLAMGNDMKTLHQKLMLSPSHRANILQKDFNQIGIGIYQNWKQVLFITQVFTQSIPNISIPNLLGQFSLHIMKIRQQYQLQTIKTFKINALTYLNNLQIQRELTPRDYEFYIKKILEELRQLGVKATELELLTGEAFDLDNIIVQNKTYIQKRNLKAVCIAVKKDNTSKLRISIGYAY